jgi:hypothetical protein
MIRDNPYLEKDICTPLIGQEGDCILTLSDSREPDLREFDHKEYILINFTGPLKKQGVDLSVQMPIKITKNI